MGKEIIVYRYKAKIVVCGQLYRLFVGHLCRGSCWIPVEEGDLIGFVKRVGPNMSWKKGGRVSNSVYVTLEVLRVGYLGGRKTLIERSKDRVQLRKAPWNQQ